MAKNILQDIVPPERRSIRNVPLPTRRAPGQPPTTRPLDSELRPASPPPEAQSNEIFPPKPPKAYPYEQYLGSGRGYSRKAIWIACGVAILIVIFSFASLFSGATLRVNLKQETVSASGQEFTAFQGSSGSGVPFEVIKISKDLGKTVPAEGEEEVEQKASGQIIIFNDFDTNDQRLIKNTRFETPEGLIYRVNESVVVPGVKSQNGSKTPGSVEVTVYADEPGAKYNIGLKDFTIPGFKGDPRFEKMYARSKTDMKGGFVGIMKKVSELQLKTARAELSDELKTSLKEDMEAQIPGDFVVYEQGMFFDFESLPQSESRGDSVQVNERGTLSAVMFNRALLSKYISEILVPEMSSIGKVSIFEIENMPVVIDESGTFDPSTSGVFSFFVDSSVTFVSQFDEESLITDLVGKHKKELASILESYPSISKADVVIKPIWKRTFPKKSKDIKVEIVTIND